MKDLAAHSGEKLKEVEKFFASYQSAVLFHSYQHLAQVLPPNLATKIHGNMPIRILDRAPTGYEKDEIPAIELNQADMKKYMLEEGSRKIFEFSVQLMYSNFEHFIREAMIHLKPEKYEGKVIYFGKDKLVELGLDISDELLFNIISIRETRNCLVHNSGVWDEKAAIKLSKAIIGDEIADYPLSIGSSTGDTYITAVGSTIQTALNQTANIKWMSTVLQEFYEVVERT
ncbi:hypothetical protein L2725_04675 [Shewanella corallii]|uniref:RiboL-PSP-HEPN domain-containing protein n=1 Tax=Shewanella corallii TaxID=560080 RepID=A0ABT0N3Z8_9GAMM|nr:hypothetical protein [Shewanella corallii]MCL2913080.1 hypothetical protein [Shewanella corallii]